MKGGLYTTNRLRAFPFRYGDVAGGSGMPEFVHELPNNVVLDAGFTLIGVVPSESPTVWLEEVIVIDQNNALFIFATDAEGLEYVPLTFQGQAIDGLQRLSAWSDDGVNPTSEPACDGPVWGGWLVIAEMSSIHVGLGGTHLTRSQGGRVEPAIVHQVSGSVVSGISLGNVDRTRSSPPPGCEPYVWPYEIGVVHVVERCLVGNVRFNDGYNVTVSQTPGKVVFSAVVGAGLGEPCEEIPLFPGETPPDGSDLLEGGLRCNETIRRLNGVQGPRIAIKAGTGFVITPDLENHELVIDVNLAALTRCDPSSELASEPASEPA